MAGPYLVYDNADLRKEIAELSNQVAHGGKPPHDPGMEARVAVLEQIAKETKEALVGIRADMKDGQKGLASDMKEIRDELRAIRSDAKTDYRWLLGLMMGMSGALLAAMAKGFHWF